MKHPTNTTKIRRGLLAGLILLLLTGVAAGGEQRWLHVRVVEDGRDGETVSVNIPLTLVEAILPTIHTDELQHGKVRLDDAELEGIDLREVLRALRDAPDADFITVKSEDETVRVAKEDGFLVVRADERRGDRVRVTVPLEVVDAMLGADADEIDLLAGLRALADYDGGDLVTVESDDTHVRVWIDSSDSGE